MASSECGVWQCGRTTAVLTSICARLYTSIDPAPPTSGLVKGAPKPDDLQQSSVDQLRAQLVDTKLSLFERYRAMFALRNIGTPAAVDALASGFSDDSALFKYADPFLPDIIPELTDSP